MIKLSGIKSKRLPIFSYPTYEVREGPLLFLIRHLSLEAGWCVRCEGLARQLACRKVASSLFDILSAPPSFFSGQISPLSALVSIRRWYRRAVISPVSKGENTHLLSSSIPFSSSLLYISTILPQLLTLCLDRHSCSHTSIC